MDIDIEELYSILLWVDTVKVCQKTPKLLLKANLPAKGQQKPLQKPPENLHKNLDVKAYEPKPSSM